MNGSLKVNYCYSFVICIPSVSINCGFFFFLLLRYKFILLILVECASLLFSIGDADSCLNADFESILHSRYPSDYIYGFH